MPKSIPWTAFAVALAFLTSATPAHSNVRTLVNEGRAALRLQTPAGLQLAESKFSAALRAAPSDAEANLLHSAVVLVREQGRSDFTALLDGLGISVLDNNPYDLEYVLPTDREGRFKPRDVTRTESAVTYARSKENLIDGALSSLTKINSENFLTQLSAEETSSSPVRIDLADVRVLRAYLHLAKGALAASESYDLSAEYALFYRLVAGNDLNPRRVMESLPHALRFSATPQARSKIRTSAAAALDELQQAILFIRSKRLPSNGTPFLFESEGDDESALRELEALRRALDGPVDLPVDERSILYGQSVNLRRVFDSGLPPRNFLSTTYDRGFFRPGHWPDPTLGGALPRATQQLMDRLALEAGVLQNTLYEPYEFRPMAEGVFEEISGIAVDPDGNLHVADRRRNVICKISVNGSMAIVAGRPWTNDWEKRRLLFDGFSGDRQWIDEGNVFSLPNSKATDVLENLGGITADSAGNIYFLSNRRVMKLDGRSGRLSLLAGDPGHEWWWQNEARDGTGSQARFSDPGQLFCDAAGNVYVCDENALRKITPSGVVTTVAGRLGWDNADGYTDGPAAQALFRELDGGTAAIDGNIYLADTENNAIRRIAPGQTVSTLAGGPRAPALHYDTVAARAGFGWILGMAADAEGNLYFSDDCTVRKFQAAGGRFVTLGGKPGGEGIAGGIGDKALLGDSGDEETTFRFLAVDPRGTLYVANEQGDLMRAHAAGRSSTGAPLPSPTPYPQPSPGLPSGPPWPSPPPAAQAGGLVEFRDLQLSPSALNLSGNSLSVKLSGSFRGSLRNLTVRLRHAETWSIVSGHLNANPHPTAPIGDFRPFEISFPFARHHPNGDWSIEAVHYNNEALSGPTLPAPFASLRLSVTGSTPNTGTISVPEVDEISLLPGEVNASSARQFGCLRIRTNKRFVEEGGSRQFQVTMVDLANPNRQRMLYFQTGSLAGFAGDDVILEEWFEIASGTSSGEWVIGTLSASASSGGASDSRQYLRDYGSQPWHSYNPQYRPLTEAMRQAVLRVGSQYPVQNADTAAPEVLDVDFVPGRVEVSERSARIKIRLHLRDASGIDDVQGNISAFVPWPRSVYFDNPRLVSGTSRDGVYEIDAQIPMQSAAGAWGISWIDLTDMRGNRASFNRWEETLPPDLRQTYFSVDLTSEIVLPELKSLSLVFPGGTSVIDTESGEAEVKVRMRVSDRTSAEREWGQANGYVGIRSPSGTQYLWSDFTEAHRVGGTREDGIYEIVFRLPRYSEHGVWSVDYVQLDDANYRTFYYSAIDLARIGISAPLFAVTGASRRWDVVQLSMPPLRNSVALRLDNVSFAYDGAEKFAAATSPDRPDLNQHIVLTYNGLTTAPVDPGVYEVRAFLGSGDMQGLGSGTLTITGFVPAVRITAQPQPVSAFNGETVRFAVAATGQAPLTYQWLHQSKPLGRPTTNDALSVRASPATAGAYSVRVSNRLGNVTSTEAALTLRPAASWQWAPDSTNATYVRETGQSVSFGVTNVTGPPAGNIAYQWQRDGANVARATNARINLDNLTLEQAGAYRLRITTSAGSVVTDNKLLEVRDRGVLVYSMTGQSSYAVSSNPRAQNNPVAAFVVVDRDATPQRVWFVWHTAARSGPKSFWVEERDDAAFDATANVAGALAVITAADIPQGASSGRDKDLVWFTGTNSIVRFRSPVPRSALAPLRMQGSANRLDSADGVRVEAVNAAMNLEQDLTLQARNANASGEQALQRVRTKLISDGFVEAPAP